MVTPRTTETLKAATPTNYNKTTTTTTTYNTPTTEQTNKKTATTPATYNTSTTRPTNKKATTTPATFNTPTTAPTNYNTAATAPTTRSVAGEKELWDKSKKHQRHEWSRLTDSMIERPMYSTSHATSFVKSKILFIFSSILFKVGFNDGVHSFFRRIIWLKIGKL